MAQIQDLIRRELKAQRDEASTDRGHQERRVAKLQAERRKLLEAHYADAISLDLLRSEQQRMSRELAEAEVRLEASTTRYDDVERILLRAVELVTELGEAYRLGGDDVRRLLNQAVFEKLYVTEDGVIGADLTEAIAALLAEDLVQWMKARLLLGRP